MICPRCGAVSEVVTTRAGAHGSIRRRRECFNGHRFTTVEVLPTVVDRRGLVAAARAAARAAALWARDNLIRKDPRPSTHVARDHGITDTRVRQIRAEGQQ